jgi:hypothetical protein
MVYLGSNRRFYIILVHSAIIVKNHMVGQRGTSSSEFVLYIECFACYCGCYFAPFRPSNSDFGYIEEGESAAGYTYTLGVGSFTPERDLLLALA